MFRSKDLGLENPLYIFFWATSESDLEVYNFDQMEAYFRPSLRKS